MFVWVHVSVCVGVCTIWQVCENQVLKLHPLCIESLDQFEGINWVSKETLGVPGGRRRQDVQPVGPSAHKTPQCVRGFVFKRHKDWYHTTSQEEHVASVSQFENR